MIPIRITEILILIIGMFALSKIFLLISKSESSKSFLIYFFIYCYLYFYPDLINVNFKILGCRKV